ncbi:hypothetical protein [Burkholderia sp. IMCC1007]|uniref:hypothetical protein n=1 Tax=Burkholderia sp. IMCC1007 TaxID=3004104 RepID=UPI0022B404F5|nr:hypothetical protein [Burkholderia sp. IMCC1007]
MRTAKRPSHRFVFVSLRRALGPRTEPQCRAINGLRFANSLQFDRISPRIAVNSPAITLQSRIGIRALRGGDGLPTTITARAFTQRIALFPNVLTMAPVNPHL